jgi:hypothetical protein
MNGLQCDKELQYLISLDKVDTSAALENLDRCLWAAGFNCHDYFAMAGYLICWCFRWGGCVR